MNICKKGKVVIPALSRKLDHITFPQFYITFQQSHSTYLCLSQEQEFCLNGIFPSNFHSLINSVDWIQQVTILYLI